LWCFEALPEAIGSERYIEQFTLLTNPANQKGATLSGVATEIGRMAADDPGVEARLSALFTKENAARAMNAWLDEFEDGLFRKTAEEINASDPLADVRRCFGTDGAWLWHPETGENEIRALLRDYRIVAESSQHGFITPVNSFWECMESWRDKTRNIRIPYATLVAQKPQSKTFLGLLKDIAGGGRLEQNDRRDAFFREITDMGDVNRDMLDGCLALFKATYSEQLSGQLMSRCSSKKSRKSRAIKGERNYLHCGKRKPGRQFRRHGRNSMKRQFSPWSRRRERLYYMDFVTQ
jgi:hypothetical protein